MSHQTERRATNRDLDDALSPEILALLVTCGGEIRDSDQAALTRGRGHEVPDRRRQDRRRGARFASQPS
jgi:hypothetical protein